MANYDGGFNEWSNIDDLPIETGMSKAPADMAMNAEELLKERCTTCHNLKRVYDEKADREEWEKIITRMVRRGAKLNDAESSFLLEYLSNR